MQCMPGCSKPFQTSNRDSSISSLMKKRYSFIPSSGLSPLPSEKSPIEPISASGLSKKKLFDFFYRNYNNKFDSSKCMDFSNGSERSGKKSWKAITNLICTKDKEEYQEILKKVTQWN